MEELASYIIKKIIDNPDDLKVESKDFEGVLTITFRVNAADMGKVIGKGGRTINAIRSLIKIISSKTQRRCNINVEPLNQEIV